jgi:hypothetical protein
MSSGSCLTSKLYDKIIKMLSNSHEAIPLRVVSLYLLVCAVWEEPGRDAGEPLQSSGSMQALLPQKYTRGEIHYTKT